MFGATNLFCQKNTALVMLIGPSITNVQHIYNGEKIFFLSPQRPFYSIQYHLGINLEHHIFSR